MAFPKSSSSANKNTTVDATLARANTPPLSIFGSLLSSPCPPNPAIQSPLGPGGQPSNESQSPEVTIDSTTPLPSKVAQITFDPHGDVILVIPSGDDPTAVARFRVNSGVLCLASPVFRAMLNPHSRFKERANLQRAIIGGGQDMYSSTPMELPLKDDDPHAFAVVLRIMHLQFHKVPVSMLASGEDEEKYKLYEMAIICDKYDMKHMLSYWLEVWTRLRFSSLSYKNIAMSTTTGCRWLFIAYAFGYREVFHSVSKELILHCHVHSSGELFLPPKKHGGLDWMLYLPQSVIDEISAKRQQAIESFVDAVHNEIERYSNPLTNLCTFAEASCDAMMLGLLFRAFRKAKIYPEASDISRKSVEEVRLILQMIEFPENIPVNKPTGCCKSPRQVKPLKPLELLIFLGQLLTLAATHKQLLPLAAAHKHTLPLTYLGAQVGPILATHRQLVSLAAVHKHTLPLAYLGAQVGPILATHRQLVPLAAVHKHTLPLAYLGAQLGPILVHPSGRPLRTLQSACLPVPLW
ncbi:hypothetical protein EV426DRAFT_613749 [Tirmania nivea]|nr:hypothetical protein EV426DRAFT_613749 [Tirmania nivea]